MADILKGLFGGEKSAASSVPSAEADDFADFATAASPAAPSHAASSPIPDASPTPAARPGGAASFFGSPFGVEGRPYTKWYRVWERTTIQDFYQELFIIPILILVVLINMWGTYANKQRARRWLTTYLPLLESEYASVGFSGRANAMSGNMNVTDEMLKQKAKNEYLTYATGRQNVSHLDVQITLYKRYNPLTWMTELVLSFFFDSIAPPVERMEATAYPFDGKEKSIVENLEGNEKDSSYDNFVWAVVHKDKMQELRDSRYDLSLTATRDHAKLPEWATVMSESAAITDLLLTPDLIKAINDVGEDLEALVITDQPIDAPKKLDATIPKKRVSLSMKLNPRPSSTTLFQYFLRLPDLLVEKAHFRAEAMRKIRATRDEEQRKIRKIDEDEKAEERRAAGDKMKKEERDRKLKGMSAEEQRKFLEREKQQEQKKGMKKRTMRA